MLNHLCDKALCKHQGSRWIHKNDEGTGSNSEKGRERGRTFDLNIKQAAIKFQSNSRIMLCRIRNEFI